MIPDFKCFVDRTATDDARAEDYTRYTEAMEATRDIGRFTGINLAADQTKIAVDIGTKLVIIAVLCTALFFGILGVKTGIDRVSLQSRIEAV